MIIVVVALVVVVVVAVLWCPGVNSQPQLSYQNDALDHRTVDRLPEHCGPNV